MSQIAKLRALHPGEKGGGDGFLWQQDAVFAYISEAVPISKSPSSSLLFDVTWM